MTAKLGDPEWRIIEMVTQAYALPDTPGHLDPVAFNRLLRSRTPARGKRFPHDHHDTYAYIARSKNLNVVAYTANLIASVTSPQALAVNASVRELSGSGRGGRPSESELAAAKERNYYVAHYHNEQQTKSWQYDDGVVPVPSGIGIACKVNLNNPTHAYFVRFEPSYIAARRKKGIQNDCDELRMLERKFAYGCNYKILDAEAHIGEQLASNVKAEGPLKTMLNSSENTKGVVSAKDEVVQWWSVLAPLAMSFAPLAAWPALAFVLQPLTAQLGREDQEEEVLSSSGGSSSSAPAASSSSPPASSSWCSEKDTLPVLVAVIAGELCVLEKVFVKSAEHWYGLPTVDYIEVFGVSVRDGSLLQEKMNNNGKHELPKGVTAEDLAKP